MGKMTLGLVQEMRRLYGMGYTQGALAKHFRLGVAQVGRIVRGECWQEDAGSRMPTLAEQNQAEQRLMALQKQAEGRGATRGEEEEEIKAIFSGKLDEEIRERNRKGGLREDGVLVLGGGMREVRVPPPSLLEGGDAPDETGGEGQAAMLERAKAYGVDMEKLLKEEGGL